jgi:S-DNA-T family DNA segregation ATPase FtsK/SpoIIIE
VDSRREAFRHEHEATASGSDAPLLLVIDDYELLRQDDEFYDVESRLARLARRGTPVGLHVVLAGSNVEIRDGRDELLRYLSQFRAGMLLQPDVELDGDLLAVRLRRQVGSPPPGRGAFVVRQRQHLVQLATPQLPHLSLTESLRARAQPSPPPSPRGRGNPLTGPRA